DFFFDNISHFVGTIDLTRFFKADFFQFILHFFDDTFSGVNFHRAFFFIEFHRNIARRFKIFLVGGNQRRLQCVQQRLFIDPLFFAQCCQCLKQLTAQFISPPYSITASLAFAILSYGIFTCFFVCLYLYSIVTMSSSTLTNLPSYLLSPSIC